MGLTNETSFAASSAEVAPPQDSAHNLQTIIVDAKSNIYGSGRASLPNESGAPGLLPRGIHFPSNPGQFITFFDVSGSVGCCGSSSSLNGPDGGSSFAPTDIASLEGISGIQHNKTLFLTGVFLDDNPPVDPAPSRLNFTGNEDFAEISPELNQTFFIGDGLTGTGSGAVQKFVVPENATRLFLAFADATGFNGTPGAYEDNVGIINAHFQMLQTNIDTTDRLSCNDILKSGGSLGNGLYNIDPDGPGGQEPITVECNMSLSGGGWTKLSKTVSDTVLNGDPTVTREYLYVKNGKWYRSPPSNLVWDWNSGKVLTGTYFYSGEGSFICNSSSEKSLYGVSCSNGPGKQWKALIFYNTGKDPVNARVQLCQDRPGIFGGACQSGVTVFIRKQ